MKGVLVILVLSACGVACAQEAAEFTPPKVYPVERYEAGWQKNPFTLKTAPAVIENASFAKDLAIGAVYGDTANPTVVVVNVKTHERTRLKQGQPAENGMKLVSVKVGDSRKETTAQVVLGSETTELHYDNSYLMQVAAAGNARGAVPQGLAPQLQQQRQVPMPGQAPGVQQRIQPQLPGQPVRVTLPAAPPPTMPRVGSVNPAVPSGAGGVLGAPAVAAVTPPSQSGSVAGTLTLTAPISNGGSNVNLTVSSGSQQQAPASSTQLVSQAGSSNIPPVPVRRRLVAPVTNAPVTQ